jgi:hypothetical protein
LDDVNVDEHVQPEEVARVAGVKRQIVCMCGGCNQQVGDPPPRLAAGGPDCGIDQSV